MPYLIVSTPRAGRWNHRLLVAKSDSTEVMNRHELVATVRKQMEGHAWLAVARPVQQMNNARTGDEILLLGDIDTARLTPEKKTQIMDHLQNYLENDLDQLVTIKIDWNREGKSDPVKCLELDNWLSQLLSIGLVETKDDHWNPTLAQERNLRETAMKKKKAKQQKIRSFFMEPIGIVTTFSTFLVASVLACFQLGCFSALETKAMITPPPNICSALDHCPVSQMQHEALCKLFDFDIEGCNKKLAELDAVDTENLSEILKDFIRSNNKRDFKLELVASKKMMEEMNKVDGTFYVNPVQFIRVRDYKRNINNAHEAVKEEIAKINFSEIHHPHDSSQDEWAIAYNSKLEEIILYLNDQSKTFFQRFNGEDGFDPHPVKYIFQACGDTNRKTISSRINNGCKVNEHWQKFQNRTHARIYQAIMKLEAPDIL